MRGSLRISILVVMAALATTAHGQSEFFRQFMSDYAALDMDLLNNPGEEAEVKDFVYQKDVATLTFEDGKIHLLRYVQGRPTTALFIGRGHARIEIPPRVERNCLLGMSRDSIVDEDFEVAIIRMADDFDLALKERLPFEEKTLKWKTFTIAKQSHGEEFFKPTLLHRYDSYFQLLRSLYERSKEGFFWVAFNRYVYSFDPNRPEEVEIGWEEGVSELIATPAVAFQRQERGVYPDEKMSDIPFPTTILEKRGEVVLGGIDGFALDTAQVTIRLLMNADSLRYVSLFLPHILRLDSLTYDGGPVDYHQRNDFDFIGVVLPEYRYRHDTLEFTFRYHGKKFDSWMPCVEDPQVCPHAFTFTVPASYSYYIPGMGERQLVDARRVRFSVSSSNQYRDFYFHAYASDMDTIPLESEVGIPLNVLRSRHLSERLLTCWVSDEKFRSSVLKAFNHMTGYLGGPMNAFAEYVIPERTKTMPGLIMVPQTSCAMEAPLATLGDFDFEAGTAVAKQWFGSLLRPASDREKWVAEAVPRFLSLLFVQNEQGPVYLSNLVARRDSLFLEVDRKRDMPLASGSRASSTILRNRGIWMLHMLRFLMYDLESQSESVFLRFVQELAISCNTQTFTNDDIVELAEKHYGDSLAWFFGQWLYGLSLPEFDVEYRIGRASEGHTVDVTVRPKKVAADFRAPVVMRVVFDDGTQVYRRESVSLQKRQFTLGPFEKKPTDFVFNEFLSVLSRDKVKKK